MRTLKNIFILIALFSISACAGEIKSVNQESSGSLAASEDQAIVTIEEGPQAETPEENTELSWPQFDWDEKHTDYLKWNEFAFDGVDLYGQSLLDKRPKDITDFCPKFDQLNKERKTFFWISLLSAMSRYESSFKPDTKYIEDFLDQNGLNVISRGLLQLSYESSLGYSCPLKKDTDLHDPKINLECSIRILNRWIERDSVITDNVSGKWLGGARYWSVLRKESTLDKIKKVTTQSEMCR